MMEEELDDWDVFQIPGGSSFKSQVSPKKKINFLKDECSVDIYSDLSMDSMLHMENNYKTSPLKVKPNCTLNKPQRNKELRENKECLDLYTDLLTSELTEKEKTNQRVKELEKVNQELLEEIKMLKQLKEQLSKNISSLFLTAKKEMKKKEAEITKLKQIIEEQKITAQQRDTLPHNTWKSTKLVAENDGVKYISNKRCKTSSVPDNKPDLAVTPREVILSARHSPPQHEGNKSKTHIILTDNSHCDSDKIITFPLKETKGVERNDSDHINTDLRLKLKSKQQDSFNTLAQNRLKKDETSSKIGSQHNRSKGDEPKAVKMHGSECLDKSQSHKANIQGNTPTKEIIAPSKKVTDSASPASKKRRVSDSDKKPHSEIRDRLQQEINQSYSLAACKGVAARRKLKDSSPNDVFKDASTHHFASHGKLKFKDTQKQFLSNKKNSEIVEKNKEGSGLNLKFQGSSQEASNVKVSSFDKKTNEKNCVAPMHQVQLLNRGSEPTISQKNSSYNTEIISALTNSVNLQTHSLNYVENSLKSSPKDSELNLLSTNDKNSTPSKKLCNTISTKKKEMISVDHESNSITQPFGLLKQDISNSAQDLALTNQTGSFELVACSSAAPQNKIIRAFPIVEMTVAPTAVKSPSLSSSFVDIESVSDEQDEIETDRNDNKSDDIEASHGDGVYNPNLHVNNDASKLLPEKHVTNLEIDFVSINDEGADDSETDLDPKNLFEQKSDGSEKASKVIAKSDNSSDSDKISNTSSVVSTDTDKQSSNDEFTSSNKYSVSKIGCSSASSPTRYVTSITCTSNLILLGDEETTCTTFISPSKPHLLPSEFYPPGVKGQVSDKSFHVRHIRGPPEVIHKSNNDSPENQEVKQSQVSCGEVNESQEAKQSKVSRGEVMMHKGKSSCKKHLLTDVPPKLINVKDETTGSINGDQLKNNSVQQHFQKSVHEVTETITESNFDSLITLETNPEDLVSSGCDRQLWMKAVQKTFQKVFQNELQSFKDGNVIYINPLRKFYSNRYKLYKKRLNMLHKAKTASLPRKVVLMKEPILTDKQQVFEGSELMGSSPCRKKTCSPNQLNLRKSDKTLPVTNQDNSLQDGDSLNEKCYDLWEANCFPHLVNNVRTAPDSCMVTSSDHSLISVKSRESCPDQNKINHYEPDSTSEIKHRLDFLVTNKAEITSDKSISLKMGKASLQIDNSDSRVIASHDVTSVKSTTSLTDQLYLSDDDNEKDDMEDNLKFEENIICTKENSNTFTNLNDDIQEDKTLNRNLIGCHDNVMKPLQIGRQGTVRKCKSDIGLILNTQFGVSDTEEKERKSRVNEDNNGLPKFNQNSQTILVPDEISLMEVSLSEFDSDVAHVRKGTPVKNTKSQQNVYVSPLSFKNKIIPKHIATEHQNPEIQDKLKESLKVTARPNKISINDISNKLLSKKLKDPKQQTAHTSNDKTVIQTTLLLNKNSQQLSFKHNKIINANQQSYVLLSRLMPFEELKKNLLVKNMYVYAESDSDERSDTVSDDTEADTMSLPEGKSNVKMSSDQKEFIQKVRKAKKKLDLDFVIDGHSKPQESFPFQSPILQVSDSMLSPPVKQVVREDVPDLSQVKTEYQSSSNFSLNTSTEKRKLEKMAIIKVLFTDNSKTYINGEELTGCFSESVNKQGLNTAAVKNLNPKQFLNFSKLCPEDVLKSKSADIEDGEILEESLVYSSKQKPCINEREEHEVVIKKEYRKPQKINVKKSDPTHNCSPLEQTHSSQFSDSNLTINVDRGFSDRGRKRSRSPPPNQHLSVKHTRKSSPRISRVSSREDIYRSRQRCRDGKDVTNNERSKGWMTDRVDMDDIKPEKKISYSNFSRDRSPQKHGQRSRSDRSRQVTRERIGGKVNGRYFGLMKNSPTRSHERTKVKSSYREYRKSLDKSLSPKEQDQIKSSRPQCNHRVYQRRSPSNSCFNKGKTASMQGRSPPKCDNDKTFSKRHSKNQRSKYSEEENKKCHSSKETLRNMRSKKEDTNIRDVSPKREISENELNSRGKYEHCIGSQFVHSSLKYIESEVPRSQYEYESPVQDNFEEGEISE